MINEIGKIMTILRVRGIPVSKVEKDCGFGNGYLRRVKPGNLPGDRLAKICEYLGITADELLKDEPQGYYIDPETAAYAQKLVDDKAFRVLFDAAADASPEDLERAAMFLRMLKATNPNG